MTEITVAALQLAFSADIDANIAKVSEAVREAHARGAQVILPPELFGREDYGAIQGMIAMPVRITMAGAPFAFGALWAWRGSYDAVLLSCAFMAVCSFVAFMLILALPRES